MHSLLRVAVVGGVVLGPGVVRSAAIPSTSSSLLPPTEITPAPRIEDLEWLIKRQDPDAIDLAGVLLTAIPVYLRQVAATNLPAVSSLIRDEFSQDQRPYWFNQLPEDIQAYLIKKFGPPTATPTPPTSASKIDSWSWSATITATTTRGPEETSSLGSSNMISRTSNGGSTQSPSMTTRSSSSASSRSTLSTASSRKSSNGVSSSSAAPSSSSKPSPSSTTSSSPSTTPDPVPDSPPVSDSGLSRNQKIGLGVGIPVGIIGAAALFLGCCFLLRRRTQQKIDGSVPPSSPGFIPHFAFQDKSMEHMEHRTPLTRHPNNSTQDLGNSSWEDEGYDPMEPHNSYAIGHSGPLPSNNPYALNYNTGNHHETNDVSYSNPGVPINNPSPIHYSPDSSATPQDLRPIMTFHTHSSNRARGMRTSYQSLRSVAEVSEPDDDIDIESPVLGRSRQTAVRSLTPHSPPAGQIKRKPVGSPPSAAVTAGAMSPAAVAVSQKLLRQTMPEHSGSSSSGLALSTANTSMSSGVGAAPTSPNESQQDPISPVSPPATGRVPSNPFSYDYIEDYGPEYYYNGGDYVDVENGLYGGNTSLSQYPEPSRRKSLSSKTEWPLRNLVGSGHRRKSSPLWDRIYEE